MLLSFIIVQGFVYQGCMVMSVKDVLRMQKTKLSVEMFHYLSHLAAIVVQLIQLMAVFQRVITVSHVVKKAFS